MKLSLSYILYVYAYGDFNVVEQYTAYYKYSEITSKDYKVNGKIPTAIE
jgi:hypothetical protein